jgi:hypothetical protein
MKYLGMAILVLGLLAPTAAGEPDPEPARTDYSDSVEVEIVQLEITAWPDSGDEQECAALATEDFSLTVNGRNREIYAVDRLGTVDTMVKEVREETATAAGDENPLTLVLFFDLWHLNLFSRYYMCPATKPQAFERAREMVRSSFRPGDRLLLVTFAGWPTVHHGWIRDPDEALAALDLLEVSPQVLNPRTEHEHDHDLVDGLGSLLLALGKYTGRKELLFLSDDFRLEDIGLRFLEIAADAQSNGVSVHAVDMLDSCRREPGPGCRPGPGGLLCTQWRSPAGIGYLATHGGGRIFRQDDVAGAVDDLRRMQGCRFLISFQSKPGDTRKLRVPKTAVHLARKGFKLQAPTSFLLPGRAPGRRDEMDALFLLPRFGNGIAAEVGLWPLRPSGKKQRWRGMALLRLQRNGNDPWPFGVDELVVDAVVHSGGRIYGEYREVLRGDELAALRDDGRSKLLAFEVNDLRPGEAAVAARVWSGNEELAANVRSHFHIPRAPRPGEARPWLLMDGVARIGNGTTLLPALDGMIGPGSKGIILGYGCRDEAGGAPGTGRLVAIGGDDTAEVPLQWLEPGPGDESDPDCGWLAGAIDPTIGDGLWRFQPPGSPDAGNVAGALHFRVSAE